MFLYKQNMFKLKKKIVQTFYSCSGQIKNWTSKKIVSYEPKKSSYCKLKLKPKIIIDGWN